MSRTQTQTPWWDDHRFLESMSIETMYDVHQQSVRFRHTYADPEDSMMKQVNMMFDVEILKNGHITVADLRNHIERQKKSEPGYTHPGPTNADLRNPAIALAWQEWLLVWRLAK